MLSELGALFMTYLNTCQKNFFPSKMLLSNTIYIFAVIIVVI